MSSQPEPPVTDPDDDALFRPPRTRQVGVREFGDHAGELFTTSDILEIKRDGETLGYFVPVKSKTTDQARRSRQQLEEALAEAQADGLSLYAALSDPSEPPKPQ